jgi:1-acyl-sn-glycerol-3-phosphate acyltransferase
MNWLIVVPRTVLTWVVGVVATILGAAAVMVIALFDDTSPLIERVIRGWSRAWLIASGTRLEVTGREHVDPDRSYVVVANHISTLDIMACFLAVRLPIRYLAKKELFKVPVLAQGMRAVGIIEVDRAARGAIHGAVNRQAKELMEKKRSLIIYAEGTRPRDGVMATFKKGAFTMAIASQLPVLPVSIHGTYQAFPPGQAWVRGGTIKVAIDAPLETAGLGPSGAGVLRDRVYDIIAGRVRSMGGAVGGDSAGQAAHQGEGESAGGEDAP